jgi:hypothetical protein
MEAIKLFVTNTKIQWGIPLDDLFLFSAEYKCSIPFDMFGEKAICRYQKSIIGIPLYVTPAFNQKGLFFLKASFDQGEKLENYADLKCEIIKQFGAPQYTVQETWDGEDLALYPCNIWILSDSILEIGVMEKRFVPVGYASIVRKDCYKEAYTDNYISKIGWDPKKYIK